MDVIQVKDKSFVRYIDRDKIWQRVSELSKEIEKDYADKNPLLLCVLNGSFMFAADLFHTIDIPIEASFVKLKSYEGTSSSGNVTVALGLQDKVKDRHVLIVEDIVDTGRTLHDFLPQLQSEQPASVKIVSFLSKPSARKFQIDIQYVGFEIPDKFVVGYGLDYDGQGRNLTHLYQLAQ